MIFFSSCRPLFGFVTFSIYFPVRNANIQNLLKDVANSEEFYDVWNDDKDGLNSFDLILMCCRRYRGTQNNGTLSVKIKT